MTAVLCARERPLAIIIIRVVRSHALALIVMNLQRSKPMVKSPVGPSPPSTPILSGMSGPSSFQCRTFNLVSNPPWFPVIRALNLPPQQNPSHFRPISFYFFRPFCRLACSFIIRTVRALLLPVDCSMICSSFRVGHQPFVIKHRQGEVGAPCIVFD